MWLPDGEKILICFDRIHERDGRTDRHRIIRMTAKAALDRAAKTSLDYNDIYELLI